MTTQLATNIQPVSGRWLANRAASALIAYLVFLTVPHLFEILVYGNPLYVERLTTYIPTLNGAMWPSLAFGYFILFTVLLIAACFFRFLHLPHRKEPVLQEVMIVTLLAFCLQFLNTYVDSLDVVFNFSYRFAEAVQYWVLKVCATILGAAVVAMQIFTIFYVVSEDVLFRSEKPQQQAAVKPQEESHE